MTKKTVNIDKNQIEFQLIESENYWCWQGYLEIDTVKTEFEIDCGFHKRDVNWQDVEDFLKYISVSSRIKTLSINGVDSITNTGRNFFSNSKEIENWKMIFKNSILFFGKSEQQNFSYGLTYDFYERTEQGVDGDAYGLYFVTMENERLINSERHQV